MKLIAWARDLVGDVYLSLSGSPVRTSFVMMAFAVCTAGLVLGQGVSATAAEQIRERIRPSAIDQVVVVPRRAGTAEAEGLPPDAAARVEALSAVRTAGRRLPIDQDAVGVGRVFDTGLTERRRGVQVFAGEAGWLAAVDARVRPASSTALLDDALPPLHVALVGREAAATLGLPLDGRGRRVWLAGRPLDVVGIIDGADRDVRLENAIIVSFQVATAIFGMNEGAADLVIRTIPGAAAATAELAPYAVRPERPGSVHVQAPVDLRNLRRGISTDLDELIFLVSGLVLLVGSMAITNAMTLSVLARRSEIGLRRALGASRRGVMALFVGEGVLLGAIGGLAGAGVGLVGVVITAAVQSWTPVVTFRLVAFGVAVGAAVGLVASVYPALRAARLEPVAAIRGAG